MIRVYMISRLTVGGAWYIPSYMSPRTDETVARTTMTPSYARVVRAQRSPGMSSRQLGDAYVD